MLVGMTVEGSNPLHETNGALIATLLERRDEFVDFLRRRTRSDVDPEDLLQQGLLTATKKIHQLREPELVVAWFYKILRRLLADHHERWAVRNDKLPMLQAEVTPATPEEDALCGCSLGLIDGLPPQYADILRRVDLGDEELTDVATKLGTTSNTAAVRLHRARKALRQRLLEFCGTTSVSSCQDCGCEERV